MGLLRSKSDTRLLVPDGIEEPNDSKTASLGKQLSRSPRLKKALFASSGIIALFLAYVGIIVPGFPAIPFIILAAYFFANSSPKIYKWMLRQRVISKLISKSRKVKRGVFKALLISQVWFSVGVAEITLAHSSLRYVLFGCGGIVLTVLILIFMKVRKVENAAA